MNSLFCLQGSARTRKRSARAAEVDSDTAPKRSVRERKPKADKDSVYYEQHMELGM